MPKFRRAFGPELKLEAVRQVTEVGMHRWLVERTFAWLNRFRRLIIRYERRDDIYRAFATLACALITWRYVQQFC